MSTKPSSGCGFRVAQGSEGESFTSHVPGPQLQPQWQRSVNRSCLLQLTRWLGEAGEGGDISPDRLWESATYPQVERGRQVMYVSPASARVPRDWRNSKLELFARVAGVLEPTSIQLRLASAAMGGMLSLTCARKWNSQSWGVSQTHVQH